MIRPLRLAAALLAAGLALAPVAAEAAPTARASATLNVRAGPGNGYPVVGQVPKNARVGLVYCTRSGRWCQIEGGGWVVASYLVGIGAITSVTPFRFLSDPFLRDRRDRD